MRASRPSNYTRSRSKSEARNATQVRITQIDHWTSSVGNSLKCFNMSERCGSLEKARESYNQKGLVGGGALPLFLFRENLELVPFSLHLQTQGTFPSIALHCQVPKGPTFLLRDLQVPLDIVRWVDHMGVISNVKTSPSLGAQSVVNPANQSVRSPYWLTEKKATSGGLGMGDAQGHMCR